MCDCNESPFNKLRESWSRHFDKESQGCSCCCQSQKPPHKVKGKFGVAYVIETPSRKCKPCGWEVEFNDTPSQIECNCRKMMNWITCPPLGQENRVDACCCSKPPEQAIETIHQMCGNQKPGCCKQQHCCCSSKKPIKKSPQKCCCSTTQKTKKTYCCRPKQKMCLCNSDSESSTDEGCCCSKQKCSHKQDNRKMKNQSTDPPKSEEKFKQSKNLISPTSKPEKSKTPPKPPLATLNQQPKKEPDKTVEDSKPALSGVLQVKPIPERKNEITPKISKVVEAINKENQPPTDSFVLPPKRRKLKRKELLKLIKEGKKEMEAVRPTPKLE